MILAGGRGARMGGVDKGLVEVAGRPMVEHTLAAVERQAGAVAINANRSTARYARYGHRVIADRMDGFQGPLAGMASALAAAATEFVLVVPCDSPLVDAALGPRLHAALVGGEANVAVAHDGERMHPVFVLVRRAARAGLDDFLARGERKIDRWFTEEKTEIVDFSDLPDMFLNVNRQEDLIRLETRLKRDPGPPARPSSDSGSGPESGSSSGSGSGSGRTRTRGRGAEGGDAAPGAGREPGVSAGRRAAPQRRPGAAGRAPKLRRPPVVGFAGYSGSGKTTLATGVVRALAEAGVRVAAIKHAHHSFDIDRPGKDSYELRRAGAVQTLVGSRDRWALVTEIGAACEPTLDELVDRLDWGSVDVVLVEGFKHAEVPKIALRRDEGAPFVDDPFIVAVALPGAAGGETPGAPTLPRLDLDRPDLVARFIVEHFLTPTP